MLSPLSFLFDRVVRRGNLCYIDGRGTTRRFGNGEGDEIVFRIADFWTDLRISVDPSLAIGEAYMDGRLTLERGTIYDFVALLLENTGLAAPTVWIGCLEAVRRLLRRFQQFNSLSLSSRNARYHYDIDSEIYALFLDEDRQYSCGYFTSDDSDLDDAQLAKMRHIAAKLALMPGHRLLDIGSGWGGLCIYLAKLSEVSATGITLSPEQLKYSQQRATRDGLGKVVKFQLEDYRMLKGTFDRIVSVGMFEHVGINHYAEFFSRIGELLVDDGVAVIHSIGRSDGPGASNPFFRRYIFPGSYAPALGEVLSRVERSGLIVADIEILRLHYAKTLRLWRERFVSNWQKASDLKGERFCRMWEFYLAGAEAAFRYQGVIVFQMQLVKRLDALPLTRDYMVDTERRLEEAKDHDSQNDREVPVPGAAE